MSTKTKTCPACGDTKMAEDFPKASRRADGLGSTCRQCIATKYPPDTRRIAGNTARYRKRNQKWLQGHLARTPCHFCGKKRPAKNLRLQQQAGCYAKTGIRNAVIGGSSLDTVKAEAAKAVCVCDGCIRIKAVRQSPLLTGSYMGITNKRDSVKSTTLPSTP